MTTPPAPAMSPAIAAAVARIDAVCARAAVLAAERAEMRKQANAERDAASKR